MSTVPVTPSLYLGAAVFLLAMLGFLTRRSLIQAVMCLELMLNAVDLTFVAFDRGMGDKLMSGTTFALFSMVIAAAEIGVGLALVLLYFRRRGDVDVEGLRMLEG